jgi:hypothetical protein
MNKVEKRGPPLSILGKIGSIWWRSNQPETLGKSFEKLIATHDRGGFAAVEWLLASVVVPGAMRANGWTARPGI